MMRSRRRQQRRVSCEKLTEARKGFDPKFDAVLADE